MTYLENLYTRLQLIGLMLCGFIGVEISGAAELVNKYRIIGVSIEYPDADEDIIRKISSAVGASESFVRNGYLYSIRDGVEANYMYRFTVDSLRVHPDTTLQVIQNGRLETWKFTKPRSVYLYAIQTGGLFAPAAAREVGNFLTSAYLVESGNLSTRGGQYLNSGPKSEREFWKRNLISQGWGAQYIYDENPYGKNKWIPVGFGYLIDAASAALIIGGIVSKNTLPQKMGLVAGGIAFSTTCKLVLNAGVAKGHMNTYNRFVNSGYPIPRATTWRDFDDIRFGPWLKDSAVVQHMDHRDL